MPLTSLVTIPEGTPRRAVITVNVPALPGLIAVQNATYAELIYSTAGGWQFPFGASDLEAVGDGTYNVNLVRGQHYARDVGFAWAAEGDAPGLPPAPADGAFLLYSADSALSDGSVLTAGPGIDVATVGSTTTVSMQEGSLLTLSESEPAPGAVRLEAGAGIDLSTVGGVCTLSASGLRIVASGTVTLGAGQDGQFVAGLGFGDTAYRILATVEAVTGSPSSASLIAYATSKTSDGFHMKVASAVAGGASVTIGWIVVR